MKFTSLQEAQEYLQQFVPKTEKWGEPSVAHARTKHFMKLIGDPQDKLKVIHVAGTSGKGSTSYITSSLLASQGLKVGMGISPHLHHILERIQINVKPIPDALFVKYINEILPQLEQMKPSEYGCITYFEAIVGLTYYIFEKEQVDVVVMETGLGGQFDATNTVTSADKIDVITRIGMDHTEYLGNTIEKIATEKVRITQKHNLVLKLQQEDEVMNVIRKEVADKEATLLEINPSQLISEESSSLLGLRFNLQYKGEKFKNIHMRIIGTYQFENISMAFAAFTEFMKREGKDVNVEAIKTHLKKVKVPGRMELSTYKEREVIIDGAHNPQKMEAFIGSLTKIFPEEKFTFLIAFKYGKEYDEILKYIKPVASHIIITGFENKSQGMGNLHSEEPDTIAKILQKMSFYSYDIVPDIRKALEKAAESRELIVITGSLYLIGDMYSILEKN